MFRRFVTSTALAAQGAHGVESVVEVVYKFDSAGKETNSVVDVPATGLKALSTDPKQCWKDHHLYFNTAPFLDLEFTGTLDETFGNADLPGLEIRQNWQKLAKDSPQLLGSLLSLDDSAPSSADIKTKIETASKLTTEQTDRFNLVVDKIQTIVAQTAKTYANFDPTKQQVLAVETAVEVYEPGKVRDSQFVQSLPFGMPSPYSQLPKDASYRGRTLDDLKQCWDKPDDYKPMVKAYNVRIELGTSTNGISFGVRSAGGKTTDGFLHAPAGDAPADATEYYTVSGKGTGKSMMPKYSGYMYEVPVPASHVAQGVKGSPITAPATFVTTTTDPPGDSNVSSLTVRLAVLDNDQMAKCSAYVKGITSVWASWWMILIYCLLGLALLVALLFLTGCSTSIAFVAPGKVRVARGSNSIA